MTLSTARLRTKIRQSSADRMPHMKCTDTLREGVIRSLNRPEPKMSEHGACETVEVQKLGRLKRSTAWSTAHAEYNVDTPDNGELHPSTKVRHTDNASIQHGPFSHHDFQGQKGDKLPTNTRLHAESRIRACLYLWSALQRVRDTNLPISCKKGLQHIYTGPPEGSIPTGRSLVPSEAANEHDPNFTLLGLPNLVPR